MPSWSLTVWLAAQRFDCATASYLGYFIPLQFSFVFPQRCVLPWIAFTRRARRLRCVVAYVVPSKIISVGVLGSCHDTTHLLGSQACCELRVFFSSSSLYIVIEMEPIEVLHMVSLAKITPVPSSCPYMLGKGDVFC